jgi:histone demethylase JARID1
VKSLLQEAEQKKFPESELLQALMQVVTEAEKCANVAQQLSCKKVRTR